MGTFIKIATDQALGFLLGIAAVIIVQPTTSGGTLLLILIAIAIVNVIMQGVRFVLGTPKGTPSREQKD